MYRTVCGRPALKSYLQSLPADWLEDKTGIRDLWPGQSFEDGPDRVLVNRQLPVLDASLLAFSDHPERVDKRGLLFSGGLLPFKPLRFQFYHEGGRPNDDLWLKLIVTNSGSRSARVQLIEGLGGPDADYFQAGHANNLRFLENLAYGCGRVLELEAGESCELFCLNLPYEQVLSGTEQFTLLEGAGVTFRLFALQAENEPIGYNLLSKASDVHARGVYGGTGRFISRYFDLTEEDYAYAVIGSVRQHNILQGPELKGDYGVIYGISFLVKNPTWSDQGLELLFSPRGGKATASMMAQAEPVRLKEPQKWLSEQIPSLQFFLRGTAFWRMIRQKRELEAFKTERLATFTVPKESCLIIRLLTIPEGASNYPVRLILRRCGSNAEVKLNHI
ncbi:hypothetical protein IJT93_08670 [bacterium]|nr:hypothetical protein [bacterium]